MAADDSEGEALMAEPVLGSNPEETEAVGPSAVPPCASSRQEAESEGGPTVPASGEEVGQGQAGQVEPAEGCLPQRGGSGLEAETPTTESEEEDRRHDCRTEEDGGHPMLGPPIPTAPSSELEGLLPRAKEEDGDDPQGSIAVENGQELPLGEGMGAGTPVSFWVDPAQCRGQQKEEEEEEETKSCCIQAEDPSEEQECPICTELYDWEDHRPAPLNCGHIICGQCLQAIMEAASAADIGRVRCPICRQKTPMMEWEICRLQEELLLLGSAQSPATGGPTPLFFSPLPARRPGFRGGLEHHFQVRFHTTRMVGFLPCLRYPPRLIQGLARLEGRCPWGYRLALVALMAAETLSLLLVFLPIALLLLLFLIMDQ